MAIAAGLDNDRPYAAMGYMAATGQMYFDKRANRWMTHEGREYSADLSKLSADQIAELDRTARNWVSAEGRIDSQREQQRLQELLADPRRGRGYGDSYQNRIEFAATADVGTTTASSHQDLAKALTNIADAGILLPVTNAERQAYEGYLKRGSGLSDGPNVMSNEQLVAHVRANPGGANMLQQVWNSPAVQHAVGHSMTGVVLGGIVDTMGDSWGGATGYNPVNNTYYDPLEQQAASWRTVAAAASFALPGEQAAVAQLNGGASAVRVGEHSSVASLRAGTNIGGVGNAGIGAGRTVNTYSGDVYSPDFVGPVQWKYFYRGDATARTDFLSSMAQERGVPATTEFLNSRATEPLSNIYAQHGIGSQGLPTIGVSDNRLVAEYFARGPSQMQNGFVTTFRMEAREAERLAIPNWDNPMSFMEPNPYIGLPEREFLFHVQIDPKYVVKQVPVGPR